jgi:hypothetical protein
LERRAVDEGENQGREAVVLFLGAAQDFAHGGRVVRGDAAAEGDDE